jgi:hypothetical protein
MGSQARHAIRVRRRRFLIEGAVLALATFPARSAQAPVYSDANLSITLPEGYLGPTEHTEGSSVSRGFRKPYSGTPLNTVILITVHDFGPSFAKRVATERARLTRETLDDVVAGIEKHRTNFRQFDPLPAKIADVEGLKLVWNGNGQGVNFDGIVYCVLVGSRAYAVQIQDPAGRGAGRLAEAVRAVERMRILRR